VNKSKLYQYKIVEISFEQNKLNNFPEERGIGYILAESSVSDTIDNLKDSLLDELYDVVNSNFLTDHQKKILLMRLMGKTQNEIAEHLGITQSAVHKAMHGNIDYKNDKKRYGGIIKKLKKVCKNNKKIKDLLCKIEEAKIQAEE
jgi:hypothetical protein